MAKRANGEGWINKNADGSWTAGGMVSLPNGRKKRIKFQAKTQKEALKKFREAKAKYEAGLALVERHTIATYLQRWFAAEQVGKTEGTIRVMQYRIDAINRGIGHHQLERLTTAHIREWFATINQHYAPATAQHIRILLNRALEDAVADHFIQRNPFDRRIRALPAKRSAGVSLTTEQVRTLLVAARGNWYESAIYLAVYLGMRRGEIAGLRWKDIDEAALAVSISGQAVYLPSKGIQWTGAKCNSERTVALPTPVLHRLQFHRMRQHAERLCAKLPPAVYVFERMESTVPRPSAIQEAFKLIAKPIGLSHIRLHDLRHTAATLMQQAGASVAQVAAALGHRRVSTTLNVYTHVSSEDADRAIQALNKLLA